ncbi:hypothetical protein [Cellulophaga sp. HaHa_2_1]|uniref:hypothetical protein n=1 Tax=Cellulophaga sp. HaHa_2_1 TaxID=2749994 RepID=UPI001C4F389C|nr:hypothetical protein [Cellulophaga sp. HaHa_2_1]QXP52851.1 hypothetical protein H0I24_02690 [Cellulophaga sp. HaHa_2_1]
MRNVILTILIIPMFSFGQDTLNVTKDQRTFCLNVVKSVIEHNCDEYYKSINDSIVFFHKMRDTIMPKSALKPQLVELCNSIVKNDSLNYQYYLQNFKMQFYKVNEITKIISREKKDRNLSTLNYYQIKEGDIFFKGANHKTRNRADFILDDAFKFIFRKINGEYKILLLVP